MDHKPLDSGFRLGPPQEITLTRTYRQPVEQVWAALTTPERLADWMGLEWLDGTPATLEAGGAFDYRFNDMGLESRARVLRLEPLRLFEHTWFDNIKPGAVVRWALQPEGSGTRLTLTHLLSDIDDAGRTASGWTVHLQTLERKLDGAGDDGLEPDFNRLRRSYADRFGRPQHATGLCWRSRDIP